MGRLQFKGQPCYFCGAPSDSAEHAPPKQMFKGFECDRITAPACEKHNSKKGGNDQAIVSALLIPIANHPERYSLGEDVKKAVEVGRPSFERAKRKALNRPLVKNPTKAMANLPNVSYLQPSADIDGWIRMLSAVLAWDALRKRDESINWTDAVVWSPDWVPSDDPDSIPIDHAVEVVRRNLEVRRECETFSWEDGWSAEPRGYPPSIYWFKIHIGEGEIAFWHKFYNCYSWYFAIDGISDATIMSLRQKSDSCL